MDIYYNHIERDNELNKRISIRNIPSSNLQPQFSLRPVSSKYEMFPIYDRRPKASVPIINETLFTPELIFNPGNAQAPWAGFSNNIDTESTLRNQFFAIQKNNQAKYIPSKSSDLYNSHVIGNNVKQPFPGLFKENNLAKFNPNKYNVDNMLFNNNTRVQYKNINLENNLKIQDETQNNINKNNNENNENKNN